MNNKPKPAVLGYENYSNLFSLNNPNTDFDTILNQQFQLINRKKR